MRKVEHSFFGGRLRVLVDERIPSNEVHLVVGRTIGWGPGGYPQIITYTRKIAELEANPSDPDHPFPTK